VAERPVAFNRKTAGRIVAAVKRVEHDPRGRVGGRVYGPTGDEPVQVKITGNSAGGGKYTGYIWLPPTNTFSLTSNASEADFGTQGPECYVWNRQEIGGSTHYLTHEDNTNQKLYDGSIRRVATDGKLVIAVNASWDEACEEA
jgi:hypothetical protein